MIIPGIKMADSGNYQCFLNTPDGQISVQKVIVIHTITSTATSATTSFTTRFPTLTTTRTHAAYDYSNCY